MCLAFLESYFHILKANSTDGPIATADTIVPIPTGPPKKKPITKTIIFLQGLP